MFSTFSISRYLYVNNNLQQLLISNSLLEVVEGNIYRPYSGADPGFQVRGGGAHLKELRRAEGGAKMFGVFRVKNHDFTPKNHIFSNFRGAPGAASLDPPLVFNIYIESEYTEEGKKSAYIFIPVPSFCMQDVSFVILFSS